MGHLSIIFSILGGVLLALCPFIAFGPGFGNNSTIIIYADSAYYLNLYIAIPLLLGLIFTALGLILSKKS